MPKARFTEEQITCSLKQAESGRARRAVVTWAGEQFHLVLQFLSDTY